MKALLLAVLCIMTAISGPVSLFTPSVSGSSKSPAIAWAFMLDDKGTWEGVEPPNVMVPAVMNSGATYVRMSAGGRCPVSSVVPYVEQMLGAGLNLGTYLSAFYGGASLTAPKPLKVIVHEATVLKNCKVLVGYKNQAVYDWVFLDAINHLNQSYAQTVLNAVNALGWSVMTHYSGWGENNLTGNRGENSNPPLGAWSTENLFFLISEYNRNKNYPSQPAIQQGDTNFIDYVKQHEPNSIPALTFEIPTEVKKFASLSTSFQISLLTSWAQGQSQYGYSMSYLLFAGYINAPSPVYDSITAGTYSLQVSLIKEYNPSVANSSISSAIGYGLAVFVIAHRPAQPELLNNLIG